MGYRFGKRTAAADADDALDQYLENGGYLRFGRRSLPAQASLLGLLAAEGAHLRKRRDVSGGEAPALAADADADAGAGAGAAVQR